MEEKINKDIIKKLKAMGIPRIYIHYFSSLELSDKDYKKFINVIHKANDFVDYGYSAIMLYTDAVKSGCLATAILYEILKEDWSEVYYLVPAQLADSKVNSWGEGGIWEIYLKANIVFIDGITTRMNSLEVTSFNDFVEYRLYNYRTTLLAVEPAAHGMFSDRLKSVMKTKYGMIHFGN